MGLADRTKVFVISTRQDCSTCTTQNYFNYIMNRVGNILERFDFHRN